MLLRLILLTDSTQMLCANSYSVLGTGGQAWKKMENFIETKIPSKNLF